jgi:uncharacterized membrane protein YbaN (DUF454 family)
MLVRMTTTTAGSIDRVSRWFLSDDLYGDERERLRWYEGIAISATLQCIAVPWAAAVLVWVLGRPVVLPLAVIIGLMYVLTVLVTGYVKSRRVETVAVRWTPKRIALGALGGLPYVAFMIGCLHAYDHPSDSVLGSIVGAAVGGGLGLLLVVRRTRQARAQEAAAATADED